VAIAGPSGSGKSTILNMIGCIDTPSDGLVIIDGTEVEHLSDTELTRTAPLATPTHSSAGAPRELSSAPSLRRRTAARDKIALRNGGESLENQEPDSMLDRSAIVRTGVFMSSR